VDADAGADAEIRRLPFAPRHATIVQSMRLTDSHLRLLVRHSGSANDDTLARPLLDHLRPLRRIGLDVWSDDRIRAGDEPRRELDRAIETADVALLLLSADFLASDFIQDVEMPLLFARHREGKLRVVPILLRACTWEVDSWLRELQPLPRGGKAIGSLAIDARDEAWTEIVREIVGFSAAPSDATSAVLNSGRAAYASASDFGAVAFGDGARATSSVGIETSAVDSLPVGVAAQPIERPKFVPSAANVPPELQPMGGSFKAAFDRAQSTELPGRIQPWRSSHEDSKTGDGARPAPNPRSTYKRSNLWIVPVAVVWATGIMITVGLCSSMPSKGDSDRMIAELTAEIARQSEHTEDDADTQPSDGSTLFQEDEVVQPSPLEELEPEWAQGVIVFYDGVRASGNVLGMVMDNAGQRNSLENNEPIGDNKAKSCILRSVREGAVISVFDSPSGDRSDDWAVVTVKKTHPRYVIPAFESDVDDDYVQVKYLRKNGLNGNISRIDVD